MKRPFTKGDRVVVYAGPVHRTGTVVDEVTDEWLGQPTQELDVRLDQGGYVRIPDDNVDHLEE